MDSTPLVRLLDRGFYLGSQKWYFLIDAEIYAAMDVFLNNFDDKLIPALEFDEAKAVLRGRLDITLSNTLNALNDNFKLALANHHAHMNPHMATPTLSPPPSQTPPHSQSHMSSTQPEFPAVKVLLALNDYANSLPSQAARNAFVAQTQTLWLTAEKYLYHSDVRKVAALQQLIEKYLQVCISVLVFCLAVGSLGTEKHVCS